MPQDHIEELDHTADVGIRARSDSLPGVLLASARGMLQLMLPGTTGTSAALRTDTIAVEAASPEDLLHAWLSELLFRLTVDRHFPVAFDVEYADAGRFRVQVSSIPMSGRMARAATEIKAVTWHGLRCERSGDGWEAEVIFDT